MTNILQLIAGGVISIVLGFIWYGPLFGKAWMSYLNTTPEEAKKMAGSMMMKRNYFLAFVGSVVTTFIMSKFVAYSNINDFVTGMIFSVFMWIGFVVPTLMSNVLWEKKPWKIFMIGAIYYLILLALIGGMVAVWR